MLQSQNPYSPERIDALTTMLAGMDARGRQAYATQHRNDPAVVATAVNVNNIVKAAERSKAMQAAGPMPTVVDQDIAGMAPSRTVAQLPENQGIAQIPAPNMQRMADGGIAGFDESSNSPMSRSNLEGMGNTDGMFNYAHDGGGVMRMAGGGHIPRYQGNTMDGSVVGGIPGFQAVQPRAEFTQPGSPENQTPWERFTDYMGDKKKQALLAEIAARINQGIARPEEIALYNSERIKAGDKAATEAKYPSNTATRAKDFPGVKAGYENVSAAAPTDKALPPPSGAAPDAPRPQTSMGGAQGIKAMYEQFAGPANVRETELNQIQERVRQQGEAETSAAQRQLDQLKTDLAAQGEYGKDREAKLKGKEERIGKEEGQAGGLALLEAGLAMMSGTSQHAFANIGQGAMVGTAAYRKSMDKIADARDKLDDAYGRLEDVRFNQKSMNNSEIRKATADVDKAANAGLKSLTDFAVTRYGLNREDAKTMFTGAMQERVANIGKEATLGAAQIRSQDNKDYINAFKGSNAIEQARKNVMDQVIKSNKYTPEEIPAAFEKEWEKTLQLNPALAKLAGTSGGGGAPVGGADFVLNAKTGQLEPRK